MSGRREWQDRRSGLTANENVFAAALDRYGDLHPLVATILAHEDATNSGQGNTWRSNFNRKVAS